ncbi:MAG TPA: serine hydrolase, partial [Phnomibacter sp.]|nr:serine hydrolase [Phnomibacter sp.]
HQSFASSNGIENRSSNIATPYTTSFTNELRPVPYDRWDNLGPAASIVSNVSDLAHWLTFQLDSGRYQGKPIIPWQALKRTRQMFIPISSQKSATLPINFRGYGLGLNMADYNGRQVYWHTGGAAGMVSNVCLVPDAQLGIAILTNNDNQSFFEALRYQILDAYLEVPFTDRSQMMYTPFAQGMQQQVQQIKEWQQAISDSIPAAALNAYTGTYQNSLYGPITLKPVGKGLQVSFGLHPGLVGQMRYMQNGEWYLEYENIEYGIFTTRFTFNNGKPSSVVIPFNDFVEMDPYTFTKQ